MSITYCGRGSAGVCVGVTVAVSMDAAASVAEAVVAAGTVSLELTGGLVGTGEEQEATKRKAIRNKKIRDVRRCGMGVF